MVIRMKKTKKILKSIGLILLLICFPSLMLTLFKVDTKTISDKAYLIYLSLSELILLIIYISIYYKTLVKDFKSYIKNLSKNFETSFKYWLVGFIIMIISNLIISLLLKQEITDNEKIIRNYINISPLLMLFSTVIYAPICEELTFRKSIRETTNNKWLYAITSGTIFAFLHVVSSLTTPLSIIYIVPYASLGIAFALLYYKTDNIFSSISVHAMHNFISVMIYIILGGA